VTALRTQYDDAGYNQTEGLATELAQAERVSADAERDAKAKFDALQQSETKTETKPKAKRGELTLAKARDTAEDLNIDPETTKAKVKAFGSKLLSKTEAAKVVAGASKAAYKPVLFVQEATQHPEATGQLISSIHTRASSEGEVQAPLLPLVL
jgi:hypothetical protein